ncbi:MAG: DUF58 domain-containing protein [Granulosicoccus sp.]
MNPRKSDFWQRVFRTRPEDSLPHVVAHQRIYIVPTKRGWAFLFALLLMLIAAVNYSLSLGYALCFLLTGLFAATLLHTYRNLAGLGINGISCSDTFAGSPLEFNITLCNTRVQPRHGIRIATHDGVNTRVRVEGEATVDAMLSVDTKIRGTHTLGRLTLQSDWPLGLWTSWSYLHAPASALVFPRPEKHAPPLPSSNETSQGATSSPGRQGDVSGLREYIPGDAIGSIAWKSAARGLGLRVRTFDSEVGPSQTLLSLQHTGNFALEEQLSRLCAWVLQAEKSSIDYALQLPHEQLDTGRGTEQRLKALRALAMHGKGI